MITDGVGADVAVSPMAGAVSFRKPVNKGCLAEMEYWLADSEGRRVGDPADTITEFLPVFVRREELVRLKDSEYNLDPNGLHVIDDRIEPLVYIGPTQQNFGSTDFTVDAPGNLNGRRLKFNRDLPSWVAPVATYAVFDALGGERAYSTSQRPVYRPPFFIKEGKDNFGLRGNRVAEFDVGQMLRIGSECFYITELRYFADPDTTRVDIWPSTVTEVGSRSPGNDVLSLITSGPITPVIDPDGTPVATTAPAGFMQELVGFPFEPVNAKQSLINFQGDLTTFAVPGHIMEIGGTPFTIASVTLSEDGTRTKLGFTSPFRAAIDPASNPTIRLSYRPIYPPGVRQFLGIGPFVASEGVTAILFGETEAGVTQPGRRLAEGTEFSVDSETGVVQLLDPLQEPLGPGQKLVLAHTKIRVMEPFFSGGRVQFPRWAAKYKHVVVPTEDNGYLGGTLTATYTFDNPDSFYFRALPLRSYLAEAVTQAVDEMKQGQSSSGPQLTVASGDDNWDRGNLGLPSQRRDLLDKDRAARTLLSFYNDAVNFFEQVDEAITGKFIGDRDGKFRFFVGRGLEYAPPGFEDEITGELNPSNVWTLVFNEADTSRDLTFLPDEDTLAYPLLCTMTDMRLIGPPIDPARLRKLMDRQRALVRNDVDDVLLLGASKPRIVLTPAFPFFTIEAGGIFDRMGAVHRFSRLFPTQARTLFTLLPGIGSDLTSGDVGVYSWGRIVNGEIERTHGTQIGQVSNPVLGDIENVGKSRLRERLPRIRIFDYFPNGLPQDALAAGAPAADIAKPCALVSQVPLADLPIDPATGYPDVSELLSQGGTLADAETGDPELALPGFVAGQKIGWGKPDGRLLAALYPEEQDVFGLKMFTSVFVDEVLHGCLLTFKDRQDNAITSPYDLLVGTDSNAGTAAHIFGIGRADTIYVLPPDVDNPISDPATESPTMEMVQQAALLTPTFRQGMDLNVETDGQVTDLSLPSWADPFFWPIKEMAGQKTPEPLSHVEGEVDFANTDQVPLQFPALLGQALDDAGDRQIPFMKGTNTEWDRLTEVGNAAGPLMAEVPGGGGAYPDEILFDDGELRGDALLIGGAFYREPSTLMTNTRTDPAPALGVTGAQAGDFVLLEVNAGGVLNWMGFATIGRVRSQDEAITGYWSWIEPPRFVTPANQGSQIAYAITNYAVHTEPPYPVNPQVTNPLGLRLFEDVSNNNTIISLQDVPGFVLNDEAAVSTGNLNTILAAHASNILHIRLMSRPDDTAVNSPAGLGTYTNAEKDGRDHLWIMIRSGDARVQSALGAFDSGWVAHGGVLIGDFDPTNPGAEAPPGSVADSKHIIIQGWNELPLFPMPGQEAQWFLPHVHINPGGPGELKNSIYGWEFALSIVTTAGFSTSAYIDEDRLTFHEVIDFRLARPRGFDNVGNPNGTVLRETAVRVTGTELGGGGLSAVNDVNGVGLTFLSRTGSATSIEGTWNPAPSPAEEGSVRVMGFEANPNTPVAATNIVASVVCSQVEDSSGTDILTGTGSAQYERILPTAVVGGDLAKVEKGDMVQIHRASGPVHGTRKAGSYLVRHAVVDDGNGYHAVTVTAILGGGGFVTTNLPRVINLDHGPLRLEIDDHTMLPATGTVFVPIRPADLNSAVLATYQRAVVCITYTGFDLGGPNPKLIVSTYHWADGSPVAAPVTDLPNADLVGKQMSFHDGSAAGIGGIMDLDVSVRGGALPDDSSVVGHHVPGAASNNATYGFHALRYETSLGTDNVPTAAIITAAPAASNVGVVPHAPLPNWTFDPNNSEAVYEEVPAQIRVHVSIAQGNLLNNPQGHAWAGPGPGVGYTLLPGTKLSTVEALATHTGHGAVGVFPDPVPAFFAAAGVFTEPSLPLYPFDYDALPNLVDRSRSRLINTVGMVSTATAESVEFEVRRVRRWHGAQQGVNDAFAPLRYAYEIRRGIVTDYTRNQQQIGTLTAASFDMDWNTANPGSPRVADVWNTGEIDLDGTNLGPFDSEDVNINPGDLVRLLDDDDVLLEEAIVSEVSSGTVVKLKAPGFSTQTQATIIGRRFEVWLRQAPIPHEQSNEQLLALITDQVIHETKADHSDGDPQNWTGGYVPEVVAAGDWATIANKLYDDSVTPVDFQALGVQRGDIVVIDPIGTLPVVDEKGLPPLGDTSVLPRTALDAAGAPTAPPYQAGQVSSLDDNRGFYRVQTVNASNLELDPVHTFAGTLGGDVLMAEGQTHLVYAIYPTVSTSVLSDPAPNTGEGQNDLRPTRKAVGGTFTSVVAVEDKHSLRPFSYRIIRPSAMFSAEVVDTVLMMRERMLSLIELFRGAMLGDKGGYYWDWQSEEHAEDLGDPADPYSGLGLFPNRLLTSLVGDVSVSPFSNVSDCLSVLDRRAWVLDRRLDSLAPDPANAFGVTESGAVPFPRQGGPYTNYNDTTTGGSEVRPVLLDHLGEILDVRDRLRAIRYTWLTYRAHRFTGTLARIRAFEAELPVKLEERKRALLLEATAEDAT